MERQPFDLRLPGDAYGNCVFCRKKSLRELLTIALRHPKFFQIPLLLDRELAGANTCKSGDRPMAAATLDEDARRVRREGYRTARGIPDLAVEANFTPFEDGAIALGSVSDLDVGGACNQGCEIG